jgi:hypothetical protein
MNLIEQTVEDSRRTEESRKFTGEIIKLFDLIAESKWCLMNLEDLIGLELRSFLINLKRNWILIVKLKKKVEKSLGK